MANRRMEKAAHRKKYENNPSPRSRLRIPRADSMSGQVVERTQTSRKGEVLQNQRKRKAEPSRQALSRPTKSRKVAEAQSPSMTLDEKSLLRTLKLPTKTEVPKLPKNLLQEPKSALHNALQGVAKLKSQEMGSKNGIWLHKSTVQLRNMAAIEAKGEGRTTRSAERAASLHLLAKLHEQNLLAQIWPANETIDNKTMQEERDAKLDIYIYAAKHGLVPQFAHKLVPLLRRKTTTHEYTIRLPEQGIEVTGRSRTQRMAEVAASLKFKQEAESFLLRNGDEITSGTNDSLNVANAKSFFLWYKQNVSADRLDIVTEPDETPGHRATVILQGQEIGEPVIMSTKRLAEEVATLVAAVNITRDNPDMLKNFFEVFRRSNNQILAPVPPATMFLSKDSLAAMRDALLDAATTGRGDEYNDLESDRRRELSISSNYRPIPPREAEFKSKELLSRYEAYLTDKQLAALRKTRSEYPMNQHAREILELIQKNQFSIIIGATGSGKTTQVPQILLNDAIRRGDGAKCNIICTQPRRIAAKSIAQRVAEERAERLRDSVGYHVRRDPVLPRFGGSITYCTTGILSMQLQSLPDQVLDNVSHLIIDEVHERDTIIDFLLTTLKKLAAERLQRGKSLPRIVLMSATIDSELFADYFSITHPQQGQLACPTLSIPGRTFPVRERHLQEILDSMSEVHGPDSLSIINRDQDTKTYIDAESSFARNNLSSVKPENTAESDDQDDFVIDWKSERGKALDRRGMSSNEVEEALVPHTLVATTIAHILKTTNEGAILTFLPGLENITVVADILKHQRPLGIDISDQTKYRTFMLHSSIPDAQRDVFDPMPPGQRKIILATNIAETSITIPDVQHVVDTGKLREKQYDQLRRITKLACVWVSKSNVKQRAGRAGRVQNGNYYALYSPQRFASLRAVGLPELLRSDLQEVCLDIRAQGFQVPVKEFLADAIEPPSVEAIDHAVENLIQLDCLTKDEALTPLGRLLASLPIHPSLGKMIVLGVLFKCLDPLVIAGSLLSERNIFISPLNPDAKKFARKAKADYACGTNSDHVAALNAFKEMRFVKYTQGSTALHDLAERNYIHIGAFNSISGTVETIGSLLGEHQIIPPMNPQQRRDLQIGHPFLNENANSIGLVKALILAGVYPNISRQLRERSHLYRTATESHALIHPQSINESKRSKGRTDQADASVPLLCYGTLAKSNDNRSTFMRDTTEISPVMACLFGGHLERASNSPRVIRMDDWLPFYIKSEDRSAPKMVLDFRKALDRMQAAAFATLYKHPLSEEDPAREAFTQNLTRLLDMDAQGENNVDPVDDFLIRQRGGQSAGENDRGSGRYGGDARSGRRDSRRPRDSVSSVRIDRYIPEDSRLAQRA